MSKNKLSLSPDERLTTGQAARALSLALGTLQNWRSKGLGPRFFKDGHRVFYLISDIQAYQEEQYIFCTSTADWKENRDR